MKYLNGLRDDAVIDVLLGAKVDLLRQSTFYLLLQFALQLLGSLCVKIFKLVINSLL